MAGSCPICETELVKTEVRDDRYFYECPRCGSYSLTGTANTVVRGELSRVENGPAKLSHVLYKMTSREPWAQVSSTLLHDILANTELPQPKEQLENLVLWFGKKQPSPGHKINVTEAAIAASGAANSHSLGFLLEHAVAKGLVQGLVRRTGTGKLGMATCALTFDGWELYHTLQRGHSSSRQAFMAMKFGDEQLDGIYRDHFKAAVEAAGFNLKRLDEGQSAGLIDDHLRVEIRQSRFLIADLTHHNNGAYWEAGYAEGLGKPVIYTCRKDVFDDKEKGTHFDANHHLTVVWEPENLGEAVEKLKATIRATLPDEARLED